MLFREYELFYRYLENVDIDLFTQAANAANFSDAAFIDKMFENFTKDRVAFLVENREGIMFDFFVSKMENINN